MHNENPAWLIALSHAAAATVILPWGSPALLAASLATSASTPPRHETHRGRSMGAVENRGGGRAEVGQQGGRKDKPMPRNCDRGTDSSEIKLECARVAQSGMKATNAGVILDSLDSWRYTWLRHRSSLWKWKNAPRDHHHPVAEGCAFLPVAYLSSEEFPGVGQEQWCRIGAVMLHKMTTDDRHMMSHRILTHLIHSQRFIAATRDA